MWGLIIKMAFMPIALKPLRSKIELKNYAIFAQQELSTN